MTDSLYKDFSERLVSSMKLRGFTASRSPNGICMKSLAEFADASEQICRRYIRGEALPSYEKVISIASHLKVAPGWLLFGEQQSSAKMIDESLLDYILKATHPLFVGNSEDFSDFVLGLLKDIRDIDTSDENIFKLIDSAVSSIASFQKKQNSNQSINKLNN